LILANDYILVAEDDREHPASFAPDPRIRQYLEDHPERFRMSERFSLPTAEVIRLYKAH
jgi:hypothetical protein